MARRTAIGALVLATGLALAMPAAPALATPPPEYPYRNALHVLPPLGNQVVVDPLGTDTGLLAALTVVICAESGTTCTPRDVVSSRSPGLAALHQAAGEYLSTWLGGRTGERLRFTFRAGGLALGTAYATANPLIPVLIAFSVDRNPVIRTRVMHRTGASALTVARQLRTEFRLDDRTAEAILFRDLRVGDVTAAAVTRAALEPPYNPADLVAAMSDPGGYHDGVVRTASLLAGEYPDQDVVNALGSSPTLHPTAQQLLSAIRDGLGVTDPEQALTLLSRAASPTGSPLVTATDFLQAFVTLLGHQPTALDALTELVNHGYPALGSIQALKDVLGTAAPDAALAALQVPSLPTADIQNALHSVYGIDGVATLAQAARTFIGGHCATYAPAGQAGALAALAGHGGLSAHDLVGLLAAAPPAGCGFAAVPIARVLTAVPYQASDASLVPDLAGAGAKATGPDGTAAALQQVYGDPAGTATHLLAGSYPPDALARGLADSFLSGTPLGSVGQAGQIAKLVHDNTGLTALDSLFGLGKGTGADECAAAVGSTTGGYKLTDVLGNLDAPSLGSTFPDPFATGSGGHLDALGTCLSAGGIGVPMPLVDVTVTYDQAHVGGTSLLAPGGLIASRLGYAPTLPAAGPLAIPDAGSAANVSKLAMLPTMALTGDFATGNYAVPHTYQVADLTADGNLAIGGHGGNGSSFTMVLPALPGTLTLEGEYYNVKGVPADVFCDDDALPGVVNAAIAAPWSVFGALDHTSLDVDMLGEGSTGTGMPTSAGSQAFTIPMPGPGTGHARCARITAEDSSLSGTLTFKDGGCVLTVAAAVSDTSGCVTSIGGSAVDLGQSVVTVAGAQANGTDYSLNGVGAVPSLVPLLGGLNYLSLLGALGGTAPTGVALAHLLTHGL